MSIMESISLSEDTLNKLRELKRQIIAEDAKACIGKECVSDIAFFWNDERVLEFMIDIAKHQIGGGGYSSYVLGNHDISQKERESLV